MASSSSSSQARSFVSPKLYDVFISHRGPDVKDTLAKQLYDLLKARDCKAFLDREEIEGGDSITSAIDNAICSSLVQIAIFSKRYAESSWCLNELVLMLQQTDALFIPVFYDVEPWELRHIQNQKSQYAAAFSDFKRNGRNLDKLDEWEKALTSAAGRPGYELSQYRQDLCEKIVSRVLQEMEKRRPLYVAKYPVGLAELVQDFRKSCPETARTVGIFGLGGIGKSTLARGFFNGKRSSYSASCFLSDVRESHARRDLHSLQSKLFKDLFHEQKTICDTNDGIGQLKHRLGKAKHLQFLIVLDDIDHEEQLDALLPDEMLTSGSLVIITTRDQSVLKGADFCYKMKGMDEDRAKALFCSHAFRGRAPAIEYERLVKKFVKFCGGLPLSLIVFGAHVYGRGERYWELELEKVKNIQPKDIMRRLKISFDGLDTEEKQIFIDIACFFNKISGIHELRKKAIIIWKASGWSAEHSLQTLKDKCLVEPDDILTFVMHDHLRDLGRQMAEEVGPPRLWRHELLRSMEAKGFERILADTKDRCFHSYSDSSLQRKVTYFISEAQLLWFEIPKGRLFSFRERSIPSSIPLSKLHILDVEKVDEELWSSFQPHLQTNSQASFELRMLRIWDSPSLLKLPDLIEMLSNLEELTIGSSPDKTNVISFRQPPEQLSELTSLNLGSTPRGGFYSGELIDLSKDRNLINLNYSTTSRLDRLETIQLSGLHKMYKLLISGEMCPTLLSLGVENMGNLNEMKLIQLESLIDLQVGKCPELKTISGLSSLTRLQVFRVSNLRSLYLGSAPGGGFYSGRLVDLSKGRNSITFKSSTSSLEYIVLSGLRNMSKLVISGEMSPRLQLLSVYDMCDLNEMELIQLESLITLRAGECPVLETISGLSSLTGLRTFSVSRCPRLKSLPSLARLCRLEEIQIETCPELEGVEGVEQLPRLESMMIKMPKGGYAWVRHYIHGLRKLSVKVISLTQGAVDRASCQLNTNLFHEVIGDEAVSEIERGWNGKLKIESSSSAITIYALLIAACNAYLFKGEKMYYTISSSEPKLFTLLLNQHDSEWRLEEVRIQKGYKATVKVGEEEKALTVLQRVVDRLYTKEGVDDMGTDVSETEIERESF